MGNQNGFKKKTLARRSFSLAASIDSLSLYCSEIARFPLLTPVAERRLARAYRNDDDAKAARTLITSNLRFVVKISYEYRGFGLSMIDLIQEGNLGLMKAVDKFDPEKGIRLVTYAVWWIRAYIRDHILRSWSLVRLGTTQAQRKLFFCLARTKRDLERAEGGSGEPVSHARIAETMKVRPEEIVEMELRTSGRDLSLDAPKYAEGGPSRADFIDSKGLDPEGELSAKDHQGFVQQQVTTALAHLDPRERFIVKSRVMSDEPLTLEALGKELGFSSERARQLEIRAKDKLKRLLTPVASEVFA